ncbi:DUF2062 domain-containing protein [Rhizobium sp. SL42]|uniref:DUF2062 domain-containing protein n=1 Tax=Rhizobium sp. SL42 TaxID=2806346 RepID=UPI001F236E5F|nr:DUF2062 domain-containing protein [Rhizobium sp. SL42]UJW76630.1 DUF2062 domain-containing protein [Rhizobium sp. SL42]
MLFRRRQPQPLSQKLRDFFWPRKGFVRSVHYVRKRILRLTASPHAIAAGVAAGVISSWTPFMGLHIVLALAIAYLIAGNLAAAALGTAFGNPLTFPLIWASTWEVGEVMLGRGGPQQGAPLDLHHLLHSLDLTHLWEPVLKPMLIGAIPLAAISAAVIYGVTYWAVHGFQGRRRSHLAIRARQRLAEALDGTASV